MKKVIIEVGSTVTKVDVYNGKEIEHLENYTILFKKNFKKENKLDDQDIEKLITKVLELKKNYESVYVCGTSIFRDLIDSQREEFLAKFKKETGIDFDIISQERENELTVLGATKNVNQKVAVLVGGGGSTEIAIYENGIKKMVNTEFGVVDVMNLFPDLSDDLATADLENVKKVVKEKLNVPNEKVDVLILAGGGHKFFALNSGFNYVQNSLYEDENQPIMMGIDSRISDTKRYYTMISLDEIRSRVDDPNWWFATRAMCAFVLVVCEALDVKFVVPTDVSMVHGMVLENN